MPAGLRLKNVFRPRVGVGLHHFLLETGIVRIVPKHGKLVAAFEISRNEERVGALGIDGPTGAEIVHLVKPVKTGPADSDHLFEILIRFALLDLVQGNVVDHVEEGSGKKVGRPQVGLRSASGRPQFRHSRAPFFSA